MKIKQNINVAVDIALFGYKDNNLHILLVKQGFGQFKNQWVLPGGFLKDNEGLLDGAKRELLEETGVNISSLEQLYTFGDNINRDPRARVISVAYLATANPSKMKLKADTDSIDVAWFEYIKIPKLPFDHNQIIKTAHTRLKAKLNYQPIGFELLSAKFPFSDLENLYMTILQRKIDRRNFRKKILGFNFLEETGEIKKHGSGRPALLYKFNRRKYMESLKEGINFEIKFA